MAGCALSELLSPTALPHSLAALARCTPHCSPKSTVSLGPLPLQGPPCLICPPPSPLLVFKSWFSLSRQAHLFQGCIARSSTLSRDMAPFPQPTHSRSGLGYYYPQVWQAGQRGTNKQRGLWRGPWPSKAEAVSLLYVCGSGCLTGIPDCALLLVLVQKAFALNPAVFGSHSLGRSHVVHVHAFSADLLLPGLILPSSLLGPCLCFCHCWCCHTPDSVSAPLSGFSKWSPVVHFQSL